MKKTFSFIIAMVFLSGCAVKSMDRQLSKSDKVSDVVDTYREYSKNHSPNHWIADSYNTDGSCDKPIQLERPMDPFWGVLAIAPLTAGISLLAYPFLEEENYTTLAKPGTNLQCLYIEGSDFNSDDCIIYRRKYQYSKDDSQVCFFNYKKYLPDNTDINTDDDFIKLVKYRDELKKSAKDCNFNNQNMTTDEKATASQQCREEVNNEIEENLLAYINGGLTQDKIVTEAKRQEREMADKKAAKEKAEKLAKQKAMNAAKRKAQLADCKQAQEKAKNRAKEIKTALGMNPDEKGLYSGKSGKIVDIANNGVFIQNDCAMANAFLRSTGILWALGERCEEVRQFIYTSGDYVNGEMFNDSSIFTYAGVYKYKTISGAANSVHSYKKTQYKSSEIDTKTYLNDKSIASCEN